MNAPIDQATQLLAINASYVRRGSVVVLDSLSKVDTLVETKPRPRISVHGQPMIDLTCTFAGHRFHYTR